LEFQNAIHGWESFAGALSHRHLSQHVELVAAHVAGCHLTFSNLSSSLQKDI
jgi:hypothetical protein